MRLFSSSPALVAAGALVWGCAVYDSSLVPTDDSLITNGGDSPSTSGKGSTSESGSSTAAAGKTTTTPGGKSSTGEAGTATAGTSMSAEGGDGGEGTAGTSGTGGRGGNGGTGGSKGGAGGTAGTTGGGGKAGGGTAGTSGGGGSGGSATVAKCADHPLTLKSTWVPTASIFSPGNGMESDPLYNPPSHLSDGLTTKRWSTGHAQAGGEWIEIDFGATVSITQLTLQVTAGDAGDYPRAYAVRLFGASDDVATAPVKSSGVGVAGSTVINWPAPITGQILRVTQTGADAGTDISWWTIAEVLVSCTDP